MKRKRAEDRLIIELAKQVRLDERTVRRAIKDIYERIDTELKKGVPMILVGESGRRIRIPPMAPRRRRRRP